MQTIYHKKERLFVLDGNKKKTIGIKPYNPLLDKNLAAYFSTKNNQSFLKLNGFINKAGEIIYDPLYKETLRDKKNMTIEDMTMYKSFQTTNKFLLGYKKKIPEYSIYNPNKNNLVLPPISKSKKKNTVDKKKRDVIDEADNESGNHSGSRSGSGEGDSGSGGDSGSDEHDKESNKESKKESDN